MENGRFPLFPFVPNARYALPHATIYPDFVLPQDHQLAIPCPPPFDFRTNGDLALDRFLCREGHPDFQHDFHPFASPGYGGFECQNWGSSPTEAFLDPRGFAGERVPAEARLWPPRGRTEEGVRKGKRSRVVHELVGGEGGSQSRVSSTDTRGMQMKTTSNNGYIKSHRASSGVGDQFGRSLSARKGKKNGFRGNSHDSHKDSTPDSNTKTLKSAGTIKTRIKFAEETRKGSVATESSKANEGQMSGVGDSKAVKAVDLDVSFKSNALVAKEIVVARQTQSSNSRKTMPAKKKINKRKVKKINKLKETKILVSPVSGTSVIVLPKKTVKKSVMSATLSSLVSDPKKDDLRSSSNTTTSINNTVAVEKAPNLDLVSEDLGVGKPKKDDLCNHSNGTSSSNVRVVVKAPRSNLVSDKQVDGGDTVGISDGDTKPFDSEYGGHCLDVHKFFKKGAVSNHKISNLASSISLDGVPLSSSEMEIDDTVCQRREAGMDGAISWQPTSKKIKVSTLDTDPTRENVEIKASVQEMNLSHGLIQTGNASLQSLQNDKTEGDIAPHMVSERSTHETISADSGMHVLKSQRLSSDDIAEAELEDSGPPGKKLKTHDNTALVSNVIASESLPKLLQAESSDSRSSKKVSNKDTVLLSSLPLSLHASTLKSNPSGMTSQYVPKVTNQPMATRKKVRESPNKNLHNTVSSSLPQRPFPPPPSLVKSTKAMPAARITSRTWRRTDSTTTSTSRGNVTSHCTLEKGSMEKQIMNQNTSYIRKGNSLVRKPASPGAANMGSSLGPPLNQLNATSKLCPETGSPDRGDGNINKVPSLINNAIAMSLLASESADPIERPDTPPLALAAKLPVNSPQGSPFPDLLEQPQEIGLGIHTTLGLDHMMHSECNTMQGVDTQTDCSPGIGFEHQGNTKIEVSEVKPMIYVKTKMNQLIARPSSKTAEVLQATAGSVSCRGYYKKKKNQLVRGVNASKSSSMQAMMIPDGESNSAEKPLKPQAPDRRGFNKRKMDRVSEVQDRNFITTSKVWSLNGNPSQLRKVISMRRRAVLPSLVPWKRKIYHSFYGCLNKNSLSMIRKLKLSRQRDTLYTLSGNGYSLHKSAVVSIGGRNLKWSKSIEKRSKQACEEATLAFAAVEKEKRKKGVAVAKTIKRRSCRRAHGERIFRVGSVRYKMDSSRRTLLRIPDEKVSSADQSSETSMQTSCVPRRLLIGNDEYIRIGNGNKLVRDPKRLARMLASEKVKWSLHNVRSRLARKKQYCQFFTRFGRCNKDDGKCPYIHDRDKVAVCTKFLKGSCLGGSCKLTHKVIPERMPDCSFFLQGLCSNESCPYRHVNVNPAASICEGFLKGYCARGDECDKKHNHTCPQYEETGTCTQRSMCKLHHPKKKHNVSKLSRPKDRRKTNHRYFGLGHVDLEKTRILESKEQTVGKASEDDAFICNGKFVDYISVDVGGEEAVQGDDLPGSNVENFRHHIALDSPESDLDLLIKPISLFRSAQDEDAPEPIFCGGAIALDTRVSRD